MLPAVSDALLASSGPLEQAASVNRAAFDRCYNTYATIVYNIVSRIVLDDVPAAKVCSDVFVCLHGQGLLQHHIPARLHQILPLIFSCAECALESCIPRPEIESRMAAVRNSLLRRC